MGEGGGDTVQRGISKPKIFTNGSPVTKIKSSLVVVGLENGKEFEEERWEKHNGE